MDDKSRSLNVDEEIELNEELNKSVCNVVLPYVKSKIGEYGEERTLVLLDNILMRYFGEEYFDEDIINNSDYDDEVE